MHYYIKRNRAQYSVVKIFCFLKGKKTNANNNNKKKATFAAETKHLLLFIYFFCFQEIMAFVSVCVRVLYTHFRNFLYPLKSKYLNALIRNKEYHITFFYHNTWSKPMFFHISTVFVSGSICGKLTPHCPWQRPFLPFQNEGIYNDLLFFKFNRTLIVLQSENLRGFQSLQNIQINFDFLSGLLPLCTRKMQLCRVTPSSPVPTRGP